MINPSKALAALAVLTLSIGAPVLASHHESSEETTDPWAEFRASGNEPFWSLVFDNAHMSLEHIGAYSAAAPRVEAEVTHDGAIFMSRLAGEGQRDFIVLIEDRICSDTMSGRPFPKSVRVFVEGRHFAGCGGDTRTLLAGAEWRVTQLRGEAVSASIGQTLQFDPDGSMSGSGGCNRFNTRYELHEGISFGPIASTRRACINSEISRLEHLLFTTLGTVISLEISEDNTLTLHSPDGPVLSARH